MVAEVEVYDDMSEQAKFNKIDDGSRTKAINLKLKKDKKKGLFGQVSTAYGTRDRYNENLRANYFKGATQLSLIANANNANTQNFTPTNLMGGGGSQRPGPSAPGAAPTGFTDTRMGGLNYSDTWNKYIDFSGNYNSNWMGINNAKNSLRQTLFTDSTIKRYQDLRTDNTNTAQRSSMKATVLLNDHNSFVITSNAFYQKNGLIRNDSATFFTEKKGGTYPLSKTATDLTSNFKVFNIVNNIIWRKKFSKAGRTLSINLLQTLNNQDYGSFNNTGKTDFDLSGNPFQNFRFNQKTARPGDNSKYTLTTSYTEPLSRKKLLEFNYTYGRADNNSAADVWDYNLNSQAFDLYNTTLSNQFQNWNEYHRVGSNFRFVERKYNFQVGASYQGTELKSDDLSKGQGLTKHFNNFLASALFNYQFMRSKTLQLNYRTQTNQPNPTQLQPVRNISNAPYYYEGNPELRQEYIHSVVLNYKFFEPLMFRNFSALVNFFTIKDKIVNSVEQFGFGNQLTRPTNMNGAYVVSGNISYGIPIKQWKGGNFQTTSRILYNHDISLANSQKNIIKNFTVGEDLLLNYRHGEKYDLNATASINYTKVRNSVVSGQNQAYYTHLYSLYANYFLPKGVTLSTDVDYTASTGRADGYNQHFTMWNASIAKQLFKNKRGEVKLSAFDILNQNISLVRNVYDNNIEDVYSKVLKQYFLLSFTLNVNKMGDKLGKKK